MNIFEILYSITKFYFFMSLSISGLMTVIFISNILDYYDDQSKLVIFFKSLCLSLIVLVFAFIFWPVIICDVSKKLYYYLNEHW